MKTKECASRHVFSKSLRVFSFSIRRYYYSFGSSTSSGKQGPIEKRNDESQGKGFCGTFGNVISQTAMITRFAQAGRIDEARQMFDKMPTRNVVTWNAMIAGLVQNGRLEEARQLFDKMPERNVVSWNAIAAGYAQNGMMENARQLFDKMPERNVVSWTAIVAGYAQNGSIEEACKLFNKMPERNVVSWNAMIVGYWQNGRLEDAVRLFNNMPERNVASWNAMITGYTHNGIIEDARQMFDEMPERNAVSWTAILSGYAQNGQGKEALKLFSEMQWAGMKPNQSTFTGVLSACADLAAGEQGRQVHMQIIRSGLESDVFVRSALVAMYSKCGNVNNARQAFDRTTEKNVVLWNAIIAGYGQNGRTEDARQLFDKMPERDVVSWNAMTAGYVQNGYGEEALKLFLGMQRAGIMPNQSTYASDLSVCAALATMEQGKQIHAQIIKSAFKSDVFVGNALITMYAKCGSTNYAHQLFSKMPKQDAVSWTAMIVGYALNGHGKEAVNLFEQMKLAGLKPNHITFIGVLSACSHAGLVDKGWHYYDSMGRVHSITPKAGHYACMVDLLGRAGRLDEAEAFVKGMPCEPDAVVLVSLLGACRMHANMELGKWAAERLFELEPQIPATYVLLSNIYAAAGRLDDVANVRKLMKDRGVQKEPGCSWIEVKNRVHAFLVGGRSHPETEKMYEMLESLAVTMEAEGYSADTHLVLYDVD